APPLRIQDRERRALLRQVRDWGGHQTRQAKRKDQPNNHGSRPPVVGCDVDAGPSGRSCPAPATPPPPPFMHGQNTPACRTRPYERNSNRYRAITSGIEAAATCQPHPPAQSATPNPPSAPRTADSRIP